MGLPDDHSFYISYLFLYLVLSESAICLLTFQVRDGATFVRFLYDVLFMRTWDSTIISNHVGLSFLRVVLSRYVM